jgi:hypothetical protein
MEFFFCFELSGAGLAKVTKGQTQETVLKSALPLRLLVSTEFYLILISVHIIHADPSPTVSYFRRDGYSYNNVTTEVC